MEREGMMAVGTQRNGKRTKPERVAAHGEGVACSLGFPRKPLQTSENGDRGQISEPNGEREPAVGRGVGV